MLQLLFFFQAEDGIRDSSVDWSSDVCSSDLVLVLGYKSDEINANISHYLHDSRLRTVINPRYQDGMSSSIQRGLNEIMNEFPSVMIIMGDHPLLDSATINMLLDRFRTSDKVICVPAYKGTRDLPVCFGKRFFSDIM